MIAFIWAQDSNNVIGKNGTLPWHLPNDLHYLKETTWDSTIVMGRKTFQSFPNGALPHRRNIVLTRNPEQLEAKNIEVAKTKQQVQQLIKKDERVFILGGAQVFQLFLPEVSDLYVTKIDAEFEGDTWMIPLDWQQFELVGQKNGIVDQNNPWRHEFLHYQKLYK